MRISACLAWRLVLLGSLTCSAQYGGPSAADIAAAIAGSGVALSSDFTAMRGGMGETLTDLDYQMGRVKDALTGMGGINDTLAYNLSPKLVTLHDDNSAAASAFAARVVDGHWDVKDISANYTLGLMDNKLTSWDAGDAAYVRVRGGTLDLGPTTLASMGHVSIDSLPAVGLADIDNPDLSAAPEPDYSAINGRMADERNDLDSRVTSTAGGIDSVNSDVRTIQSSQGGFFATFFSNFMNPLSDLGSAIMGELTIVQLLPAMSMGGLVMNAVWLNPAEEPWPTMISVSATCFEWSWRVATVFGIWFIVRRFAPGQGEGAGE